MDCDPDSNPDLGPGARVNAANKQLIHTLISGAFEHSVLCVQEIQNAVFYTAVYGPYKPIYGTQNVQTHLKSIVSIWEIYALYNVVSCIAVYGPYKPYISRTCNMECSSAPEINCRVS